MSVHGPRQSLGRIDHKLDSQPGAGRGVKLWPRGVLERVPDLTGTLAADGVDIEVMNA